MNHLKNIQNLLAMLIASKKIHLLVIKGPPGWGKTQTVTEALRDLNLDFETAGSFATPLALFNQLSGAPDKIHLLDDTADLFSSQQLLALLCSAVWPTQSDGLRLVKRISTTSKASAESFQFAGKIIVITNNVPKSPLVEALLSRGLEYCLSIDDAGINTRLMDAAQDQSRFPRTEASTAVAQFLCDNLSKLDLSRVNLRTLEVGYDMACFSPHTWNDLFCITLPWLSPAAQAESELIQSLMHSGQSVESQAASFSLETGKSRRAFFYARKAQKHSVRSGGCLHSVSPNSPESCSLEDQVFTKIETIS